MSNEIGVFAVQCQRATSQDVQDESEGECAQSARGVEKYASRVRAENNSQMMAEDKAGLAEPRRGSHFAVCRSRNRAQPGWHNSPISFRYTLLTKSAVFIELFVNPPATNNSMFCQAIDHSGRGIF